MMEGFVEARKLGAYATPEVRALFEEWIKGIEQMVLDFIRKTATTDAEEISRQLNLSKESALFFIGKLAREGKIEIGSVRVL
jgi:hypothetical protein